MSTYLITGAAGFIGSTLADRLLNEGHDVINIDNFEPYYDVDLKKKNISLHLKDKHYHFYEADIRDLDKLNYIFAKHKIDCVIHIAAKAGVRPSIIDPKSYEEVNIRGTSNVLSCAQKYGISDIVFASSSSVYGNQDKHKFSEDEIVDKPISPYATTKIAGEYLCYAFHRTFGLNCICLRFFTVYGPRQRPDLAINKFASLIESGKPVTLYGDGSTYRDYTFIDDIVSGICLSVDYLKTHKAVYEIINLGSESPITLLEMVTTIEKAMGKKANIEFAPMQQGDVVGTYADISKARKLLNYSPSVSFSEGIERFIKWRKTI